jgi:hypothetical protein
MLSGYRSLTFDKDRGWNRIRYRHASDTLRCTSRSLSKSSSFANISLSTMLLKISILLLTCTLPVLVACCWFADRQVSVRSCFSRNEKRGARALLTT